MAAAATDLLQEVGIASATTLDSPGYTIGDTSITVVSVSTWPTATGITFAMDQVDAAGVQVAGTYNEYVGVKASATSITNVSHQNGTNQNYTAGATTRVYIPVSAERENRIVEWGLQDHTQLGYHETLTDTNGNEWIKQTATTSAVNEVTVANAATTNGPTISATGDDTNIDLVIKPKGTGKIKPGFLDGWSYNTLPSVSSVTNNGNRSFDVTFASTVASYLTPGMRVRTSRTVAAPTGALTLNGTTQYASKSSPAGTTFTDDFCAGAWVKLSSYPSGNTGIISRYNGTSGWILGVNANGGIFFTGYNGGAGNYSGVNSYQSLPLNKWVHVAAQLDMSAFTATTTTSYIMLDGVDVPASVGRAGTNPTALVQAGDLTVGAANATGFLPGRVAQAWYSNAKITQANIKPFISQTMSGSETSIVSAFKLDQASGLNDLNANANNLTATGSPTYSVDSPFSLDANGTPGGTYDYGIVTKVATTTATVQFPEGSCPPTSGGVSAVDLSSVKSPFGFPADEGRWTLQSINKTATAQGSAVANTWYYTNIALTVPVGSWKLGSYADATSVSTAGGATSNIYCSISTSTSSESDAELSSEGYTQAAGGNSVISSLSSARFKGVSATSATPYYSIMRTTVANNSNITMQGGACPFILQATPSHL